MDQLAAVSWALVLLAWAGLAAYAVTMHWVLQRLFSKGKGTQEQPMAEEDPSGEPCPGSEPSDASDAAAVQFLTARRSANVWLLGMSLYAGVMGAWAVSVPAEYATFAGATGLVGYMIGAALAVLTLGMLGIWVNRTYPEATSLPDFLRWRFGSEGVLKGEGIRFLIACVCICNMGLPLLAEYATVASLFRGYVGTIAWPAVLTEGLATTAYTALGGLAVSLLTDRVQSAAALLMIVCLLVVVSQVAASEGPAMAPMTAGMKGFTSVGFGGLLTQPLTLVTFVLFNEGAWQRVWASASEKDLWRGAIIGGTLAAATVGLFGAGGLMAQRAGKLRPGSDPNLAFFALFTDDSGTERSWEGVLVLVCGCVMSMAAVDSLQLGLQGILSSTMCKGWGISWTRSTMLVVNIPLIVAASFGLTGSALTLFLLEAMVTCCCAAPVVLVILPMPDAWRAAYTEVAALVSIASGAVCLSVYGLWKADWAFHGLWYAWYENGYAYDYFLVATLVPLLVSLVWCSISKAVARAVAAREPALRTPEGEAKSVDGDEPPAFENPVPSQS